MSHKVQLLNDIVSGVTQAAAVHILIVPGWLQHCQTTIATAGDHVAHFIPGVQVRVIDLHRVHSNWGREVSARCPAPDRIQQPVHC